MPASTTRIRAAWSKPSAGMAAAAPNPHANPTPATVRRTPRSASSGDAVRRLRPNRHQVRNAALSQLLRGGPLAESLHVVLVLVVAALVWDSLPLALTAGWVGAVTAAAGLRTWWRLGLSRRTASPEEALRGVRLTVAGVGLAWGFGAAAAIPALGLDEAALILVVLAGLVAGATGTLVGDRRSFLYLLLTVLSPLPIGILLQGHSRQHVMAIVLIAMFAWGMDRVHRRAHRSEEHTS